MTTFKNLAFATSALVMTLTTATIANADDHGLKALGLSGDKTLMLIDTATAKVKKTMDVEGVDRLLGIDLRPNTGQIIGVTSDHTIVEIDAKTGKATEISKMDKKLPLVDGQSVIVDFNPKADKLRFMTGTTNHRVNVDTGAVTVDGSLAFEEKDMHKGEAPNIVAAAYINSYGKPDATKMYDIDATIVALIQQTSPNDGTLAAIGKLGIDGSDAYAFDVATNEKGENTAWLAAKGGIHTVSLETGKVVKSWAVEGALGAIRDITFLTAK